MLFTGKPAMVSFVEQVLKMKIEMDKNMEKRNTSKQNVFGLD